MYFKHFLRYLMIVLSLSILIFAIAEIINGNSNFLYYFFLIIWGNNLISCLRDIYLERTKYKKYIKEYKTLKQDCITRGILLLTSDKEEVNYYSIKIKAWDLIDLGQEYLREKELSMKQLKNVEKIVKEAKNIINPNN